MLVGEMAWQYQSTEGASFLALGIKASMATNCPASLPQGQCKKRSIVRRRDDCLFCCPSIQQLRSPHKGSSDFEDRECTKEVEVE